VDAHPFRTAVHDDVVTVYLTREEIRDLDTSDLGAQIAAAIDQRICEPARVTFAEFEPSPRYSVHDVLSGDITWDELSAQDVA